MQQGELSVIGQDSVTITLQGFPSKVNCHFKDHFIPIPCNPHYFDELTAEVHRDNTVHSGYVLKIFWNVSGIRDIVFHIFY